MITKRLDKLEHMLEGHKILLYPDCTTGPQKVVQHIIIIAVEDNKWYHWVSIR
jgi:hypothetical protein